MIPNQYLLSLADCNGSIGIKLIEKESSIPAEQLSQAFDTLHQLRGKEKEAILSAFPEASEELIAKIAKPLNQTISPMNEMKDFKYEFVSTALSS
jgi:hypothetical protein